MRSNIIRVKRKLAIGLDMSWLRLHVNRQSSSHESVNTQRERNLHKCVSFSCIEIREYGRVLTDHPGCQDGLAIGIDWKHTRKSTIISVDVFEKRKCSEERGTRAIEKLSTLKKKDLLVRVGGYPPDFLRYTYRNRCLQ
jgi:hypothetical protein